MKKFKVVSDYIVKEVAIVEAETKKQAMMKVLAGQFKKKEIVSTSTPSPISFEEVK